MKKFIQRHSQKIALSLIICGVITLFFPGMMPGLCGMMFWVLAFKVLTS